MSVSAQAVYRAGSGEPLVLIHGFSCTRLVWLPVLGQIERAHDVLAVNLAGRVGGPLMDAILRDGPPRTFEGITCPVLLAWGTRDRIIPSPRYSRRLREMIPAAEWLELPGLGHIPMFDDPQLVARTIGEFTARAAERAPVAAA